ncbi:hypothetical protein TTHERM_000138429 (macronuclear) [Tetrahymena thermophila SB210]|uniref:Uncharacterized protein n=1 Tax=Tetrahymena thermophila (strain SB210) TaxID=312017 RepID=W7X806_TETTS|nr:hypothetical protein TTHERM_000138429 [Tetrahymena thermophila SB210]EWS73472.1 hypothetical protein TTHERM_000138429 [Tetrahymena thermophila SB210]|eukprot:XP_012653954.1 hypothetical protein TTHERM_000138429 [Tetrahymena thermophila SB210]
MNFSQFKFISKRKYPCYIERFDTLRRGALLLMLKVYEKSLVYKRHKGPQNGIKNDLKIIVQNLILNLAGSTNSQMVFVIILNMAQKLRNNEQKSINLFQLVLYYII